MSHPKQVKYLTIWNPGLVILYYTNTYTPTIDSKIQFLTKENCYYPIYGFRIYFIQTIKIIFPFLQWNIRIAI
jgi:hypothetical protein